MAARSTKRWGGVLGAFVLGGLLVLGQLASPGVARAGDDVDLSVELAKLHNDGKLGPLSDREVDKVRDELDSLTFLKIRKLTNSSVLVRYDTERRHKADVYNAIREAVPEAYIDRVPPDDGKSPDPRRRPKNPLERKKKSPSR